MVKRERTKKSRKSLFDAKSTINCRCLFGSLFLAGSGNTVKYTIDRISAPVIFMVVAFVAIMAYLFFKSSDKAVKADAKRNATKGNKREQREILKEKEQCPELPLFSQSTSFSCPEEELINLEFRKSIAEVYDVKKAQAHYDYLDRKWYAQTALKKKEAEATRVEMLSAKEVLEEAKKRATSKYESLWCNLFYRIDEVKNLYSSFVEKMPSERIDWIGDYFQSPKAKVVKIPQGGVVIFTPLYMVYYTGIEQNLQVIPYGEVTITSELLSVLKPKGADQGEEIHKKQYLHQNNDGSPDKRFKVNPASVYVYRGRVYIKSPSVTIHFNLNNKTNTTRFANVLSGFVGLFQGKYKTVSVRMINHDEQLKTVDSIVDAANKEISELAKKKELQQEEAARLKQIEETKRLQIKAEEKRKEREAEEERKIKEAKLREAIYWNTLNPKENMPTQIIEHSKENEFSVTDGTITTWKRRGGKAVIEQGIATTIGQAFRRCFSLKEVDLPDDIKVIEDGAFEGCVDLQKVVFPKSIESIGEAAFERCIKLASIDLPNGLTEVSPRLFADCSYLETVVIPSGVKSIGERAFYNCSLLEEIELPEGVTSIGDGAFINCASLKRIVLPNTVVELGKDVFAGCNALEAVVLGDGIKQIPANCFKGLDRLICVMISNSLECIGDNAFSGCSELSEFVFVGQNELSPNGEIIEERLKIIGQSAFEDCQSLESFELPEGLRIISDYAFRNCKSLAGIVIPLSVEELGKGAFQGCSSLSVVVGAERFPWKKEDRFIGSIWLAEQCDGGFIIDGDTLESYVGLDENVEIPQGVKVIGENAFLRSENLIRVFIPYGVERIEAYAFSYCKKLAIVQIPDSVMQIDDSAFWGSAKTVIRCTRGSVASAFRIRNKMLGEYMARQDIPNRRSRTVTPEPRQPKPISAPVLKKPEPPMKERVEYKLVEPDSGLIGLQLQEDNRKITNNIFNLRLIQDEPADGGKDVASYEAFVINDNGNTISNVVGITTDLTEKPLVHKAAFTLAAQEKYDKNEAYYVVIRKKDAEREILSKTQYQIDIAFAPDFDF